MKNITTLNDLNLSEKDFKIKIIGTIQNYISNNFIPKSTIIVEINNCKIKFESSISFELGQDLKYAGIDYQKEIIEILKYEAINVYINSLQFIRKKKLEKLEKYGNRRHFTL